MKHPHLRHSAFLALAFFLLPFSLFLLPPAPALAQSSCVSVGAAGNCDSNPQYPVACDSPAGVVKCCATSAACSADINQRYNRTSWYAKPVLKIEKDIFLGNDNEVDQPKWLFDNNNKIFANIGIMIAGNSSQVPPEKRMTGAIPAIGSAIAFITAKPPVHTAEYIAYLGRNAGFQAYAANERGGFDLLNPIQKIWVATRNIAYLITSLILVVIGFMIMLRKKIDAQTVIGVQQALPKLVVTLLLITFSYAIAGLVIDMMYFLIYFTVGTLGFFGVLENTAKALEQVTQHSAFGIGLKAIFVDGMVVTSSDALGNLFNAIIGTEGKIGQVAGSLFSQSIAFVLVAGAILFAVFKLFFSLLMAYIQIIVSVIVGPLQLMLNALPGSDAFSKWFRNLLANAMAFPVAAIMLIFGAAFIGLESWGVHPDIGFQDEITGVKWLPPLINLDSDAVATGQTNAVDAVQALIGIGIIFMSYKAVDMVKEWVQAPEFKYGSAIGEAVGFGWGGVKRGVGGTWGATAGYNEDIAAQRRQAAQRYAEIHGVYPSIEPDSTPQQQAAWQAIQRAVGPQRAFGGRGERGWIRERMSKFLK